MADVATYPSNACLSGAAFVRIAAAVRLAEHTVASGAYQPAVAAVFERDLDVHTVGRVIRKVTRARFECGAPRIRGNDLALACVAQLGARSPMIEDCVERGDPASNRADGLR